MPDDYVKLKRIKAFFLGLFSDGRAEYIRELMQYSSVQQAADEVWNEQAGNEPR